MGIQIVDPYISLYAFEKAKDPSKKMVWRAYKKDTVEAVDKLVSYGVREKVTTMKDWDIILEIMDFFKTEWPQEFEEFKKSISDIRHTRKNNAMSKSKEIMYVGALPLRFMKLVKVVFPQQQFDKKFIWKIVRKIPLLKITGENNLA